MSLLDRKLKTFLRFHPDKLPSEPSPEEIRKKCLEIQKRWSPTVRESRRVYERHPAVTALVPEIEEWLENNL